MAHMQSSRHILDDFAEQMKDVASVDKPPEDRGSEYDNVFKREKTLTHAVKN